MITFTPQLAQVIRPNVLDYPAEDLEPTVLPFIRDVKGKRRFWDVSPTGDYDTDWHIGERYALELLAYLARSQFPFLFTWVVMAMPGEEDRSGIEAGFLGTIGAWLEWIGREALKETDA